MHYKDIDEIRKEFGLQTSDIVEIKSKLRKLLQDIHPDKNNGNFKNDAERAKYDKIIAALDFIETPRALVVKTELTALTKVVTELIQANKSNDYVHKYETELSKKVETSIKLYHSSHLFPKITSSVVTALLTFIWLSPNSFADNPILSKYLSSTSPLFSVIWLTSIIFSIQLWYILNRKEQRELRLKTNLNLENTQNQIFHEFINWKVRNSESAIKIISFNKTELIDFITNLRINRNEIRYETGLSERQERLQNIPFFLLTNNVSIDIELAQSLTDLIIARAEKKGVVELEKSKSLTDKYKIIVS